jgi:hypothetical protein
MLVLTNRSPRRGYLLTQDGKPFSLERHARNTGCSTEGSSRLLRELDDAEVDSIADGGLVFCRRSVRPTATFKGHAKGPPKGPSKGGENEGI